MKFRVTIVVDDHKQNTDELTKQTLEDGYERTWNQLLKSLYDYTTTTAVVENCELIEGNK